MTIEKKEIQIFREYLQIPSVHPDVDYGKNVLNQTIIAIAITIIHL